MQVVAFNFDDLHAQASRYLAEVRKQAEAILAQARREAEAIKASARAAGYQEGLAAARSEAEEALRRRLEERLASVLPALQHVVEQLELARLTLLDQWQRDCLHVAVEIARRILRRELREDPRISLDWIAEALQLAAGSPSVEIHLSPDDCTCLQQPIGKLALPGNTRLELVADPELPPGECRMLTRYGMIDLGLEAQLGRLEEELA